MQNTWYLQAINPIPDKIIDFGYKKVVSIGYKVMKKMGKAE